MIRSVGDVGRPVLPPGKDPVTFPRLPDLCSYSRRRSQSVILSASGKFFEECLSVNYATLGYLSGFRFSPCFLASFLPSWSLHASVV